MASLEGWSSTIELRPHLKCGMPNESCRTSLAPGVSFRVGRIIHAERPASMRFRCGVPQFQLHADVGIERCVTVSHPTKAHEWGRIIQINRNVTAAAFIEPRSPVRA